MTDPTHDPATPGARKGFGGLLLKILGVVAILAIVSAVIAIAAVTTYNHGKHAGACKQQAKGIEDGYLSALRARQLPYQAEFIRGSGCTSISVKLSSVTQADGHATTTTCPVVRIKRADKFHSLPYTPPIRCTVVDRSSVVINTAGGG